MRAGEACEVGHAVGRCARWCHWHGQLLRFCRLKGAVRDGFEETDRLGDPVAELLK